MKNEKQTEKDFNDVIEKTYKWVEGSSYFDKYDTLTVINGMLFALFTWIYHIAPSFKVANKTILACLEQVERVHSSDRETK